MYRVSPKYFKIARFTASPRTMPGDVQTCAWFSVSNRLIVITQSSPCMTDRRNGFRNAVVSRTLYNISNCVSTENVSGRSPLSVLVLYVLYKSHKKKKNSRVSDSQTFILNIYIRIAVLICVRLKYPRESPETTLK